MSCTADKAFLDTNILVYLYSENEPEKQLIARELISDTESDYLISTQVVGEFINILFRKFGCSIPVIRIAVDDFIENFRLVEIHPITIHKALFVMEKYRFSYWDSMIISSALENECTILYSEDLHDGQIMEKNLRITNPFL